MALPPIQNFLSSISTRDFALSARPVSSSTVGASDSTPSDTAVSSVATDSVSAPSNSQLQATNFRSVAKGFAAFSSVLEVAQLGIESVDGQLSQLQTLGEASLTDTAPDAQSQAAAITDQINQITDTTSFGGVPLLDGNFNSKAAFASLDVAPELKNFGDSLPSLDLQDTSPQGLFGTQPLSFATPTLARASLARIAEARAGLQSAANAVTSLRGQINYSAASIDTAISNSLAASSDLSDSDYNSGFAGFNASLLADPAAASRVQSANLSPSLLSLIDQ